MMTRDEILKAIDGVLSENGYSAPRAIELLSWARTEMTADTQRVADAVRQANARFFCGAELRDKVSIATFPVSRVLGYRLPSGLL